MSKRRGAYITFDGGEGTGKSTQTKLFKEHYPDKVITVREPGQTIAGVKIRGLLLDAGIELTDTAELLLFNADRNLTYSLVTKPALERCQTVISDRSYLSTLAYQYFGRGLSRNNVDTAAGIALGTDRPDMHVIFDVPYEQAFARMGLAGKKTSDDRFESEERDFHNRVRNGFIEIAKDLGKRAILLDASGTPEELYKQLEESIGRLIQDGVAA